MITRAYLVGRDVEAPDDAVGGLPTLLRQALSLQDAGIEELILIGVSGAPLRADARLRIAIVEREPAPIQPDGDAIVAPPGCIWHPAIARRLVRHPIAPGDVIAVGGAGAALYACGRSRVAAIVADLAGGATIGGADVSVLALRPLEFVLAPRTAAERGAATTCLLRSLHKPTDGLASRHLHRRISLAVTRLLLPYPITPNQMTLVAAAFGVAGVLVAYRGGYWRLVIGAALFETQNILDGCDGEISRLKYLRSRTGEWLDQVIDDVLNIGFLTSVGVALVRGGHLYAWWLTVAALVSQVVHVTALYAGLILKAGGRGSVATLRWWVSGAPPSNEPAIGSVAPVRERVMRLLGDLTRRDLIALAYLMSAVLNVVPVVFVWHVVVTCISALVVAVQWIVWGGPEFYSGEDARAGAATEAPSKAALSRASR